MTHRINSITAKISSQNTEQLKAALAEVLTLADLTSEEKRELAAAVSTTFYRDHAGDEALAQLIDQGESVLASMGPEVAEWVIEQLVEADAESAEHFAGALGQIGAPVVDLLRSWFDTSRSDDYAGSTSCWQPGVSPIRPLPESYLRSCDARNPATNR